MTKLIFYTKVMHSNMLKHDFFITYVFCLKNIFTQVFINDIFTKSNIYY